MLPGSDAKSDDANLESVLAECLNSSSSTFYYRVSLEVRGNYDIREAEPERKMKFYFIPDSLRITGHSSITLCRTN